jgi:uncharacterized protein YlaN (UPF0358 family)
MKLLAIIVCVAIVGALGQTSIGGAVGTDVKIDVEHWTNDTEIIGLVGSVSTTVDNSIAGHVNVTVADVDKVNETLSAQVGAVLNALDEATTVAGVHEIKNELTVHLEANITLWKTEHEALVVDLHGNVTEWAERKENVTTATETALGAGHTDAEVIKAVVEVQIANAEETLVAAQVASDVLKDQVHELYKNITELLVKYASITEAIANLKISAGVINATVQAQIDAKIAVGVEIKAKIHELVDKLAATEAVLIKLQDAVVDLSVEVKAEVAEAVAIAGAIKADVWADVHEVKEEWKADVTHAEEEIKAHVNEWLENAEVKSVDIAGLDTDKNITVTIVLDVKTDTAGTQAEIEHKIELVVAGLTGSKLANVTVDAHAGVKRGIWTADAQVGGNDIYDDSQQAAAPTVAVATVALVAAVLAAMW